MNNHRAAALDRAAAFPQDSTLNMEKTMTTEQNKSPPRLIPATFTVRLQKLLRRTGFLRCPHRDDPAFFDQEECEDCAFFGQESCSCTWVKVCFDCGTARSRQGCHQE